MKKFDLPPVVKNTLLIIGAILILYWILRDTYETQKTEELNKKIDDLNRILAYRIDTNETERVSIIDEKTALEEELYALQ